jgi:hypothetical protein
MTDIAIHVENLSKRYRIGARQKRANTLRETLGNLAASPFDYLRHTLRGPTEEEIIWALKDVSFEVKRGEVVGIPSRGSGQALGETGRGRRRCSRSSPASPSRRRGKQRSMAGWAPCWRWAPASTPN